MNSKKGFTLLEILLGLALISIVLTAIFSIIINLNNTLTRARIFLQILSTLQDEIEKIKTFKYEDIGISGGWPPGKLPKSAIINKYGLQIQVNYYVRNIDDPKDGTVTSTPKDFAPADYKLVELVGKCLNCSIDVKEKSLSTIIAPKTVEAVTNNGSLFIQVINAEGKPVSLANIKVTRLLDPTFTIEDLSGNDGFLRLIDIPPGKNAYAILVTKDGYSSDKTYPPDDPQNPNSILPHQTVETQGLTTVTFQIDKLANADFYFKNCFCQPQSYVKFELRGTKLIGSNPDVIKNDIVTTTDEFGYKNLSLEWDSYYFYLLDDRYVVRSSQPFVSAGTSINILPGNYYKFNITVASTTPLNLLVGVFDQNGNFISNAQVFLNDGENNIIKFTGEEEVIEDDWSQSRYTEITSGIETELYPGEIRLKDLGGYYPTTTEWLISKTIDFGTSTNLVYKRFVWKGNVPYSTQVKFQVSANNDNSTWNFIGPDGTSNTYFTTSVFDLPEILNNKRYFRYKVYLDSFDGINTPIVDQVKIFFSSPCFSPGEVLFQNLKEGVYTLQVSKQGYSSYNENITISSTDVFKAIKVVLSQ